VGHANLLSVSRVMVSVLDGITRHNIQKILVLPQSVHMYVLHEIILINSDYLLIGIHRWVSIIVMHYAVMRYRLNVEKSLD
jgi:hypothetical protein